jgi:hypothetical protein
VWAKLGAGPLEWEEMLFRATGRDDEASAAGTAADEAAVARRERGADEEAFRPKKKRRNVDAKVQNLAHKVYSTWHSPDVGEEDSG